MNVAFHPLVINYLDQLAFDLYEKEYFGFYEAACEYIYKIVEDISNNIHLKPHNKAPRHFTKHGRNMYYITYQSTDKLPGMYSSM